MKAIAWTAALLLAFTIGLNLRPDPITYTDTQTIIRTDTIPAENGDVIVAHLSRDVRATDHDDETLFACFQQLVQADNITDDAWHAAVAWIERKWAGDACQALDHYLEYGWW
jgi:hypothetical protein